MILAIILQCMSTYTWKNMPLTVTEDGKIFCNGKEKFQSVYKNKRNRRSICTDQGNQYVHRVVWEHFYGKIPSGYCLHHKDGNASNNHLSNLEVMPHGAHTKKHIEEDGPTSITFLTDKEIEEIKSSAEFQRVIAKK